MYKERLLKFFIFSTLLMLPVAAFGQQLITSPVILKSFAKIIRDRQYSCQRCEQVKPTGNHQKSLGYTATCKHNHSYTVLITPAGAMVVKPVSENLLVQQ